MSATMILRLDEEIPAIFPHDTIEHVVLGNEAIRVYLEINEWQIDEIKEALQEAGASDFALAKDANTLDGKGRQYEVNGWIR